MYSRKKEILPGSADPDAIKSEPKNVSKDSGVGDVEEISHLELLSNIKPFIIKKKQLFGDKDNGRTNGNCSFTRCIATGFS